MQISQSEITAAAQMETWQQTANHNPEIGEAGRDYFRGRVTVERIDSRIITLQDEAGKIHRVYRDQWLGLHD